LAEGRIVTRSRVEIRAPSLADADEFIAAIRASRSLRRCGVWLEGFSPLSNIEPLVPEGTK
jgi:hypothetical protein